MHVCADDGTDGEVALLKWVYGKIVNTQSEDFLGRQRELYAGRERDAVVLDLYEDLAYGWRSLQVRALCCARGMAHACTCALCVPALI